jgi:CBS domain-containing protein/DNA-binding CsgD family transcriptional regulator
MTRKAASLAGSGLSAQRKRGWSIELTPRQLEIVELVKKHAPVTGEQIAESLGVSRPTIRSDLTILIMLGHLDAKPKVGYFPGKVHTTEGKLKDKLIRLKVKDRMSRPVVIGEQETVNDAVIALFMENTGMLAVTDEGGLLAGVVSLKDLIKVTLGNPAASSIPIRMVMTRLPRVVSVRPEDTIWEAARKMLEHQVGGLPVVRPADNAEGSNRLEVVGRITKTNLAQVLVDLSSEL